MQLECEPQNHNRLGEIGGDYSLSFYRKEVGVLNKNKENHVLIRQEEAVHCLVGCRLVNALVQNSMAAGFKAIYCGLRRRLDNFMEESFTEGKYTEKHT